MTDAPTVDPPGTDAPDAPDDHGRRRRRILGALGAGIVAGLVAVGVLALAGLLPSSSSGDDGDVIDDFLAAYRRSKETTYVVEAEFTRTMEDGRQLASAAVVAQRPPDELRRQLGAISGRLQNQWLNCSTVPGSGFRCAPGGPVEPWNEAVDAEVDALRGYLLDEPALYSVSDAGDGCFELERLYQRVEAPYGLGARLCFDEASGAMDLLEVRREGGATDRFAAVEVRTDVTDADFVVEQDEAYDPRPIGG
jgi:hypothetical protein